MFFLPYLKQIAIEYYALAAMLRMEDYCGLFSTHYTKYTDTLSYYVDPAMPRMPRVLSDLVVAYLAKSRLDFALYDIKVSHTTCFTRLIWTDSPALARSRSSSGQELYVYVEELDDILGLSQSLYDRCKEVCEMNTYPTDVVATANLFRARFDRKTEARVAQYSVVTGGILGMLGIEIDQNRQEAIDDIARVGIMSYPAPPPLKFQAVMWILAKLICLLTSLRQLLCGRTKAE